MIHKAAYSVEIGKITEISYLAPDVSSSIALIGLLHVLVSNLEKNFKIEELETGTNDDQFCYFQCCILNDENDQSTPYSTHFTTQTELLSILAHTRAFIKNLTEKIGAALEDQEVAVKL